MNAIERYGKQPVHLFTLLRDHVYQGSWQGILQDLQARRKTPPRITKLDRRLDQDIGMVRHLIEDERNGRELYSIYGEVYTVLRQAQTNASSESCVKSF